MFGSLGITELILILVIVLIIFGAGKLPKIGEGMGKALKGFKKEIREAEPIAPSPEQAQATDAQVVPPSAPAGTPQASGTASPPPTPPTAAPPVQPQMGPMATPGTTAYMVAQQAWKPVTPPPVAPPAPATGSPTAQPGAPTQEPAFKAVVNKDAVKRVMSQQAALKTKEQSKDAQAAEAAGISDPAMVPRAAAPRQPASKGPTPADLQSIGSGLGDALRTFREAANDVRRAVDPEMHTIKAEMEAAQKEIQSSIDQIKQAPHVDEPPPKP